MTSYSEHDMSVHSVRNLVSQIKRLIFRYRKPVVGLIQLGLMAFSYIFSFVLRLDLDPAQVPWEFVLKTLPLLLISRLLVLRLFHLYQGLWRYVGVTDIIQIVKATTGSDVSTKYRTWGDRAATIATSQ